MTCVKELQAWAMVSSEYIWAIALGVQSRSCSILQLRSCTLLRPKPQAQSVFNRVVVWVEGEGLRRHEPR